MEIGSLIFLYIIIEKDSHNNRSSRESIEKLDKKYEELKAWLASIGYSKKNEIKQLCNRCKQQISIFENKMDTIRKLIDKIFNFFLLPIFVALVSWVLKLDGEVSDRIFLLFTFGILGLILYIFTIGTIEFLQPIIGRDNEKMKQMVADIQGVLDRKFTVEDIDIMN